MDSFGKPLRSSLVLPTVLQLSFADYISQTIKLQQAMKKRTNNIRLTPSSDRSCWGLVIKFSQSMFLSQGAKRTPYYKKLPADPWCFLFVETLGS